MVIICQFCEFVDVTVMMKCVISFPMSTQTAWKFYYWCDGFSNWSFNTK